mmetsp:Transcript_48287/g.89922  ORF Transcript_48287/g.89922 Transcript_48287/m.89922 type:complete len:268 (+) Transcript_48287:38-841(+)
MPPDQSLNTEHGFPDHDEDKVNKSQADTQGSLISPIEEGARVGQCMDATLDSGVRSRDNGVTFLEPMHILPDAYVSQALFQPRGQPHPPPNFTWQSHEHQQHSHAHLQQPCSYTPQQGLDGLRLLPLLGPHHIQEQPNKQRYPVNQAHCSNQSASRDEGANLLAWLRQNDQGHICRQNRGLDGWHGLNISTTQVQKTHVQIQPHFPLAEDVLLSQSAINHPTVYTLSTNETGNALPNPNQDTDCFSRSLHGSYWMGAMVERLPGLTT